jgi:hypothetical protein
MQDPFGLQYFCSKLKTLREKQNIPQNIHREWNVFLPEDNE